jgi:hypothetical protein
MRGRDPREWPISPDEDIRAFFRDAGCHVIYFAGYGELGYSDPTIVPRTVRTVLRGRGAHDVIVHCGTLLRTGGEDGIADVYRIASQLGFATTGIHPSVAWEFATTHRVSVYCDNVFFVWDAGWGGTSADGLPSDTLRAHLSISDEMVLVGGGRHAAQEMLAFHTAGKPIRYVPASMNPHAARGWCRRAGLPELDTRGAVASAWPRIRRSRRVTRLHLTTT